MPSHTQKERKKNIGKRAVEGKKTAAHKKTAKRINKQDVKRGDAVSISGNKAGRQAGIKHADKARAKLSKAKQPAKKASVSQKKRRKK